MNMNMNNSIFIDVPKKKVVSNKATIFADVKKPITNAKLENSLTTMKASFDEIEAAKHHTVVIEAPASRKAIAGQKKRIITKPATTTAAATTTATASTSAVERKPIIIGERKVAKKSNIKKLLGGKKFDMSN